MLARRWRTLLLGLIVLALLVWFFRPQPQPHAPEMDSGAEMAPQPETPAPRAASRPPASAAETGPPSPPADEIAAAIPPPALELESPPRPVLVDSFEAGEQLNLSGWRHVAGSTAGHFDTLTLSDGTNLPDGGVPAGAVLVARGWARERTLGIPISDVLLARCGRIVARTQTGAARPDVARIVHPNLERAGWEARVLPGDLPACADDRLTAHAVLPGDPAVLVDLIGAHAATVHPDSDAGVFRSSAQSSIRADAYPLPPCDRGGGRASLRARSRAAA
jgi:hypothetical protein